MIFLSHYLNWDELLLDRLSNTADVCRNSPFHPLTWLSEPRYEILCLFFDFFSTGTHQNNMMEVLDGDWFWLCS